MNEAENDSREALPEAVVHSAPQENFVQSKRDRPGEDIVSETKRLKLDPHIECSPVEEHQLPTENAVDTHVNNVTDENLNERLKKFDAQRNLRRRRRRKIQNEEVSTADTTSTPAKTDEVATAISVEHEPIPSWCQSISDYRPSSLIKSIANERVNRVKAFASCDFAYSVISEKDRTGKTPFTQALLTCNPTVLGLLLSVENRSVQVDSKEEPNPVSGEDGLLDPILGDEELNECEYVTCDDKYENVPLFHLPMTKIGTHPTLQHKLAMVYALLLWPKLADFETHATNIDESIHSVLVDVRDLLQELARRLPNFALSEKALQTVDIEATDYEDLTVLQRLSSLGATKPLIVLMAAGAQVASGIPQGIQSRDEVTFQLLLGHHEVQQLLSHRFWVIKTIEECIEYSSWKCLDCLVRTAPDITGDDFEHVARYAEALGVNNEFLEVFRRAIEHEEPELTISSIEGTTGIYTHPDCVKHLLEPMDVAARYIKPARPENPSRLEVLLNTDTGVLHHPKFRSCAWRNDCMGVCMADILRVHEYGYIELLCQRCLQAESMSSTQGELSAKFSFMDHDTAVSSDSWKAAKKAAGCVIQAIEDVCNRVVRNAFCCVRPPGHHIGTYGAVNAPTTPGETLDLQSIDAAVGSQGFCLLNNVAIGAAYAKYNFPSLIDRIAIVDFDIHHGNGTEQIVRNLSKKRRNLQIDGIAAHGLGLQASISIPSRRIWRDEDDDDKVFLCSVHGYDGSFYPATGEACDTPTILNIPILNDVKNDIRTIFTNRVCPALINFAPDLILLSAGFDGHAMENIGGSFSKCSETDFRYITALLVSVANMVCEGRVVSVLEGGYDTLLGPVSPFARSVASHVDALLYTSTQRTAFLTDQAVIGSAKPGTVPMYSPEITAPSIENNLTLVPPSSDESLDNMPLQSDLNAIIASDDAYFDSSTVQPADSNPLPVDPTEHDDGGRPDQLTVGLITAVSEMNDITPSPAINLIDDVQTPDAIIDAGTTVGLVQMNINAMTDQHTSLVDQHTALPDHHIDLPRN